MGGHAGPDMISCIFVFVASGHPLNDLIESTDSTESACGGAVGGHTLSQLEPLAEYAARAAADPSRWSR